MSDVQAALKALQEPVTTQCKIGDWIDSLSEDDQAAVADMFGMEISDIKLHAAITPIFRVSREMLRQHRGMSCRCFRP